MYLFLSSLLFLFIKIFMCLHEICSQRRYFLIPKILTNFLPKFDLYTSKLRFSDVFRGCRSGTLGENGLIYFKKMFSLYFLKTSSVNPLTRLSACFYHVSYAFLSESTLWGCVNVKELLARNSRLGDCNGTQTHNHSVSKQILNHLAKWLNVVYELSGCGFKSRCSYLIP